MAILGGLVGGVVGMQSAWACVPQPTLVAVLPDSSGPPGTEVTIDGLGFDRGGRVDQQVYESPAARMRADNAASRATRPPKVSTKDHSLTPTLLAERWQDEARALGIDSAGGS